MATGAPATLADAPAALAQVQLTACRAGQGRRSEAVKAGRTGKGRPTPLRAPAAPGHPALPRTQVPHRLPMVF